MSDEMILKEFERKNHNIERLEELLRTAPEHAKEKIQNELRMMKLGLRAERETAYVLDFHFGHDDNYVVLHGLRLEVGGRVAQIDHLVITKGYGVYIFETKNMMGTVHVDANGDFRRRWRLNDPYVPIDSPIEQVKRHQIVLDEIFRNHVEAPRALFLKVMPLYYPVIVFHNTSKFYLHHSHKITNIINKDRIRSYVTDNAKNERPLALKPATLQRIGNAILSFHVDRVYDYEAKFGIPSPQPEETPITVTATSSLSSTKADTASSADTREHTEASETASSEITTKMSKYQCEDCNAPMTMKEARYCWFQKAKVQNKMVCAKCRIPYVHTFAQPRETVPLPLSETSSEPIVEGVNDTPAAKAAGGGYRCQKCAGSLTQREVRYCRYQKVKFQSKLLCQRCQKTYLTA